MLALYLCRLCLMHPRPTPLLIIILLLLLLAAAADGLGHTQAVEKKGEGREEQAVR